MKTVIIESPFKTRSGYGSRSRDLIKSILKAYPDYDIKLTSLNWGQTPFIDVPELEKYEINNVTTTPDIYIHVGIPNETKPKGKFNILFTAGMETNMISREWIEGCNLMDLVIVSSKHSRYAFQNTYYPDVTLDTPIEVLFEGNNPLYKETTEIEPIIKNELDQLPTDFNFLFVGQWLPGELGHDRKDIGKLIETFKDTFQYMNNKPGLILKTNMVNNSEKDKEKISIRIQSVKGKSPIDIYLLHGELTDEQMNSLYNHSKVKAFVSFSKGEGWGRDGAHFSTCGKPMIMPNYSGHLDYLDKEAVMLLNGEMKNVHQSALATNMIIPESKWFYINYQEAQEKMINLFMDYDKYLKQCKPQQKFIENFTIDKMTEKLKEIFELYI